MNNYNKVFLAIKAQCAKQRNMAEINNFDGVAKEAGVPVTMLEPYLEHLQNLDLIKFSMKERYLYLTAFGKKQEQLTKN